MSFDCLRLDFAVDGSLGVDSFEDFDFFDSLVVSDIVLSLVTSFEGRRSIFVITTGAGGEPLPKSAP